MSYSIWRSAVDAVLQLLERHLGWMARVQPVDLRAQVRRAPVAVVALLRIALLREQLQGLLGAREASLVHGQPLVQHQAAGVCGREDGSVTFQARQLGLALGQLGAQARDLVARRAQRPDVLGAFQLVEADGLLEPLLGLCRAAIRAGHGLLEPVAQPAVLAVQGGDLRVADARGRAVELLRRQAGQLGDRLVHLPRVGHGLVAELQADRARRSREVLDQVPGRAVLVEVDLDLRVVLRAGRPRAQVGELLRGGGGGAEEAHLDGLLERGLARLVGAADHVQARREVDRQVRVAAHVVDAQAGDSHGCAACPA